MHKLELFLPSFFILTWMLEFRAQCKHCCNGILHCVLVNYNQVIINFDAYHRYHHRHARLYLDDTRFNAIPAILMANIFQSIQLHHHWLLSVAVL